MATPSPSEQIASEINSLRTKIGWMQDSVRLKNALNQMEDLQTYTNGLPQLISGLRSRGYVFEKELESQAVDLARQWSQLHPPLMTQINIQSSALQGNLRSLELKMTQLNGLRTNPLAARPLISNIEADLDLLEDKVRSAESTINGMYDAFNRQISEVKKQLEAVDYTLTQLAEARFTLLPSEGGIMAVKAVWCKDVKEKNDDPEGVFYLTDQRVLFEQKEEVATKKILFITTATQKVQELRWEIPVALIEEVKPSKLGMLKNEDHLDIRFGTGAALGSVHLHIWQDGNTWQQLLNRAHSKDFDRTRAVGIDPAEVAKTRAVPAQCASCGANLGQILLRGQDTVKCEYCGYVIRL